VLAVLGAIAALAIVVAAAWPSGSKSDPTQENAAVASPSAAQSAADTALLKRHKRAQAVEPVAGESGADAALPSDDGDTGGDTAPSAAASSKSKPYKMSKQDTGPTKDASISDAQVINKAGVALPPIEAPEEVKQIIQAGNQIARTPYLWGGGHGKWLDKGYDCSGSVSYALASAGLLNGPLDSGRLMGWGKPGKGKWITIYANAGHVFMFVAGIRFDTSGTRTTGSRWQADLRPTGGFVARHPAGL
jgi:cell wall-associated NlpC family hydrolase